MLAGYAALALAFNKLHDHAPHSRIIAGLGIGAALLLFGCGWAILDGVHQRMKHSARLNKAYFRRLHSLLQFDAEPEPTGQELKWWWAIVPQFILLCAINLGFVAWIIWWTVAGKSC